MLVPINLHSYVIYIQYYLASHNLLHKSVTEIAITVSSVKEFHALLDSFRKITVCIYIYIYIYIYICISYNTGKSALPDIYARARGRAAPEGECVYIRQSTSACVITNMLHFRHSKNLPKLDSNISASLYSNGYSL